GSFKLQDALEALGMRKAFQDSEADFGGMNDGREPLHISAVVHRAIADVGEEGTEAAAATGVEISTIGIEVARPTVPVFRADHPFVFTICDTRTGVMLFIGRMSAP